MLADENVMIYTIGILFLELSALTSTQNIDDLALPFSVAVFSQSRGGLFELRRHTYSVMATGKYGVDHL